LAISLSQRQKFQGLSLRELLAVITPEWLIPGLIYERQVAMVYGPPDSFKSFIILHLASLLAHAMMWNGYNLKPRPVLYVAAEGATMMSRRRKAWFLNHELPLNDDNLTVIDEPVMLLDPADVRLFINTQKRKGWSGGVVAIDTVSKCVPGARESDVEMMSQVIASADLIAKELNCAVILIHHTGWDGAHARGSSASLGNCDAMIRIDRKSDHHATMTVEKQKDAKRQTFEFVINRVKLGTLDRNGEEITSLCAIEASQDETAEDDAIMALADRISIATAMTCDEMKQSDVTTLLVKVLGLSERQARRRIIAAVPEKWTRTRSENDFVELRRIETTPRNIRIERRQITT
jgi:RecA-family ATPase